jgi:hypothetical protein
MIEQLQQHYSKKVNITVKVEDTSATNKLPFPVGQEIHLVRTFTQS